MPVSSLRGRMKREDEEFEASLGYIECDPVSKAKPT
jgi:hypothetical protein